MTRRARNFVVPALLAAAPILFTACTSTAPRRAAVRPAPARTPLPSAARSEEGLASWYGEPYHGRATASGTRYDMWEMTAAHRTLPFGTKARIVNLANGRVATVLINDRGPFVADRILDLSRAAAETLDAVGPGVIPVRLEIISQGDGMVDAPCWEVQVGAFAKSENVERAQATLARFGLPTRTAPAGGGLTRVRVTGVGDRARALARAAGLQDEFPGATAVPCGGGA